MPSSKRVRRRTRPREGAAAAGETAKPVPAKTKAALGADDDAQMEAELDALIGKATDSISRAGEARSEPPRKTRRLNSGARASELKSSASASSSAAQAASSSKARKSKKKKAAPLPPPVAPAASFSDEDEDSLADDDFALNVVTSSKKSSPMDDDDVDSLMGDLPAADAAEGLEFSDEDEDAATREKTGLEAMELESVASDAGEASESDADEAEPAVADPLAKLDDATALNFSEVRSRVEDIIQVLSDFRRNRPKLEAAKGSKPSKAVIVAPGRSRQDYLKQLKRDMANLYGYNDHLLDLLFELFSPAECFAFIEAQENERPLVLRVNTLRTTRRDLSAALKRRGAAVEPLAPWSSEGLKVIESRVPLSGTPEYLAGHFMQQSPSSYMPVLALDAQPGDRVVDMAAAPGGKTTYLAQIMKNRGVIFANDSSKTRLKALVANCHRLGVQNCVASVGDALELGKFISSVDRVLLDAPCTGLGVISRDPTIKAKKSLQDVWKMCFLQKKLVLVACDLLKPGGTLVYSTCSVAVEENESVANYLLTKRHVKLVDAGLPCGSAPIPAYRGRKFDASISHCRRFYPHVQNFDGFFVSKFVKIKNGTKGKEDEITKALAAGADPATHGAEDMLAMFESDEE